MKTSLLSYVGGILLLGCMAFAVFNLGTADRWIALWLPFVVAGSALALAGAIASRRGRRHVNSDSQPQT